jgi:SAM-dependent methyltransferase
MRMSSNTYIANLAKFKAALNGGQCEHKIRGAQLSRIVDLLPAKAPLSALDLGCGNGKYLASGLDNLKCAHRIEQITGVDIEGEAGNEFLKAFPRQRVRFVNQNFNEGLPLPERDANIIFATHSLYYSSPETFISEILPRAVGPKIVCITLWSEQCALYKLHRELGGNNPNTAEHWLTHLEKTPQVLPLSFSTARGSTNFESLASDDETWDALLAIVGRNEIFPRGKIDAVRKSILSAMNDKCVETLWTKKMPRVNGVITFLYTP